MNSTVRILSAIRRMFLVAIAVAITVGVSTRFASAAEDATATATVESGGGGVTQFASNDPVDSSRVWIVLLIFLTALAIAAIVSYVMRTENRDTRNWVRDLLAAGHAVSTDQVVAVLHPDSKALEAGVGSYNVIGLATIARGADAKYQLVDKDGNSPTGVSVKWEIGEGSFAADQVDLKATDGPITMLLAKELGIFILKATVDGGNAANAFITVVESVSEPKQSGLKGFFLGDGYGTINLALFLMAIVAALGAIGVVGDGTVSTIFGAMAGYIFGIAVVTHGKSGESGSDGQV